MSLIDLQRDLESFPDQMLAQETQQPSGQYPLYLVAAEVQRRADLRERFAAQQAKGQAVQPSVLDQRLAQMGLAAAPPQGQQMPQMPAAAGGGMQAPSPMGGGMLGPPQRFQPGGRVRSYQDDRDLRNRYRAQLQQLGLPTVHMGDSSFAPYDMDEEQLRLALEDAEFRMGRAEARFPGIDTLPPVPRNVTPGPQTLRDSLPEANPDPPQANDADPGFFERLGLRPFWEMDLGFNIPNFGAVDLLFTRRGMESLDREIGGSMTPWFTPAGQQALENSSLGQMLAQPDATRVAQPDETQAAQPDETQANAQEQQLTPEQRQAMQEALEQQAEYARRVAEYRQRLMGMPDEVEAQLARLGQSEGTIASMLSQGDEDEARVADLEQAQGDMVRDFATMLEQESAVEKALSSVVQSPAELARRRRNRALAQLGAVIGGATRVGDVAEGLGGINESIYRMREEQEDEQRDIQMAMAGAQDARERERRSVLIEQGGREVAQAIGALERARARMQAAISARALNANAAAQLLNTLQTSIAASLRAAGGASGGAMDMDTLLKTIDTMRQLREEVRTGRMEGLQPEEQQATVDLLFRLDDILQQALEDPRLMWSSSGIPGAGSAFDAMVGDAISGMGTN